MKKFNYTPDMFKGWAARQAGFDFQPYPTYKKTIYDIDDCVFLGNRIYKSLIDANIWKPDNVDWWIDVVPAWEQRLWAQGEYCAYEGKFYLANTNTENIPTSADWTEQSIADMRTHYGICWANQTPDWTPGVYAKDAVVLYDVDMSLYVSLADDNQDIPGVVGGKWKKMLLHEIAAMFDNPLPWEQPVPYKQGDRVIAMDALTFKFFVYESNIDNNYSDPSTTTDSEQNSDGDLRNVILDSEIEEAIREAGFKFNPGLFKDDAERRVAFSLLVAFFMTYDRQMASTGVDGGYRGLAASKKIGEMSISYMADPALAKGSQAYAFFARNPYGLKYYNLVQTRLKALSIAFGRTTSV